MRTSLSHRNFSTRAFILLLLILIPRLAYGQEGAQASAAEATAAQASGSINGRVLGDDGKPFADIAVYLYSSSGAISPRSALTDASGRFQFQNLPHGFYGVRASPPAYVELPDESRSPWEGRPIRTGDYVQLTLVKGGVITGTVLNGQGEPLVAAYVRAIRVRDSRGRRLPLEFGYSGVPRITDDRGVYRLYGLQPGSYIVIAGGNTPFFSLVNPYESDAPTYYPSSTRDTAVEVAVRAGEESTGVDIRYRHERGYTISGTVAGTASTGGRFGLNMMLTRATTGILEVQSFMQDAGGRRVFSLSGIPDGDYDLMAQGFLEKGEAIASAPRRITVRGADVTGLQLELMPLASVAGRVTLEPSSDKACVKIEAGGALKQTMVTVRRDDWEKDRQQPPSFSATSAVPNEQGEFVGRNLDGGIFRMSVRPPGDDWYVRAVTLPQTSVREQAKAASGIFSIKRGERVTGLQIALAQGAASLRGLLKAPEGGQLPANLRAYLVPTERERADDLLRYAEAQVTSGGSFIFNSLAPGRYWIVFRASAEGEALQAPRMVSWDEEPRKALRREAEAANNVVELKPCQPLNDYQLTYAGK